MPHVIWQSLWQWRKRSQAPLAPLPPQFLAPVAIGLTSLAVTGGVLGLRQLGTFQPLELAVYDQMVRLRPDRGPDPRLLLVTVTEADIQAERRFPISDQSLATVLARLQQHQPVAIGLDFYRDLPQPPGTAALAQQLQRSNLIAIRKISDADEVGVAPPPNVPDDRVGFNDVVTDPDAVIRRSLLSVNPDEETTLVSFSLRLALAYLKSRGITPQTGQANALRLGKAEFIPWEADSGQYQTIDARGYQILLDYRTRPAIARQLTLTQVLRGDFDPTWIQGKVVLIGATARSAKDLFHTPYSAAEVESPWMPGVLIHAQMVSQILSAVLDDRPLVWDWSAPVEAVWIGAWAILGGSLAWFLRHPLASALVGLGAIASLVGVGYLLFLGQGWVPIAAPSLSLIATATTIITVRARQAQHQQVMMMKLLGQNTSPEIATALWNSRDRLLKSGKLPGQRLTATIVFTDIRGFSTISESMPPEKLLEWLNEYLSAISQEVHANQGIINKFTGDGMLAVFGVPVNRTTPVEVSQDAQLAVACAIAMGAQLTRLNQEWQTRGLPQIQMRVGIFTGSIVAGSLGGKERLEYGVIGDSVNIAARLESYEKDRHPNSEVCRILMTQETLNHLDDQVAVEPWGPAFLKGKHQSVNVYRVLGWTPEAERGTNAPVT